MHNKVSNAFMFPNPIHALTESNKPCRVLAFGDVEGNSPSYLCIDAQGQSNWLSISKVQITDPNYLPSSYTFDNTETRQHATR